MKSAERVKTIIVISPRKSRGEMNAGGIMQVPPSVHIPIDDPPQGLAIGDVFYLSLFASESPAEVVKRIWRADQNKILIMCETSQDLYEFLVRMGTREHSDHPYTLPDQEWK